MQRRTLLSYHSLHPQQKLMVTKQIKQAAVDITNTIYKEGLCVDQEKKLIIFNEVREILASGMTKDELLAKISNYKEKHPRSRIDSIYIAIEEPYNVNTEENLIDPNKFYYHHRLQLTPGLPVVEVKDDGTIKSYYPDFFLAIVDRFTVIDMAEYIARTTLVQDPLSDQNIGGLRYLIKKYSNTPAPYNELDLLLYTIDAANGLCIDLELPPLVSSLKLANFINEGWQLYYNAYNSKKSAGLDHVIPRKGGR